MIGYAALLIAIALLASWVIRPLLTRRNASAPSFNQRLDELAEAKHAIYRSILDLEFDHRLGKVGESDYLFLRRQHESEAIAILREMDRSFSIKDLDDVLEEEIAAARTRRSTNK